MGLWKQQGHRIRATQTHWSTNDLLPQAQMLDLELQGYVFTLFVILLWPSLYLSCTFKLENLCHYMSYVCCVLLFEFY